jgi:thymidylate kinase
MVYFITGAEGVGKSTILHLIKKEFGNYAIHDFDEVGVPLNPPLSWRIKATKYWLKVSKENEKKGKETIIIGLSFPEEIKKFSKGQKLNLCLIDISIKEREKRLRKRKADKEVIEDTFQLFELRKQFRKLKKKIINSGKKTPQKISNEIIKWVKCEK